MLNTYSDLVKTGFVGNLKRDVLMNASDDIQYVCSIPKEFIDASHMAKRESIACAVRLIEDLLGKGLCSLATWSSEGGSLPDFVAVQRSHEELATLVADSRKENHPLDYFFVSTPAGDEWVSRYDQLIAEL